MRAKVEVPRELDVSGCGPLTVRVCLSVLDGRYAHPTVVQGAPDQYVFDRLWEANALDLQEPPAVLPVTGPPSRSEVARHGVNSPESA